MAERSEFLSDQLAASARSAADEINMSRTILAALVAAAGGSVSVTWQQLGEAGLTKVLRWETVEGGVRISVAKTPDQSDAPD